MPTSRRSLLTLPASLAAPHFLPAEKYAATPKIVNSLDALIQAREIPGVVALVADQNGVNHLQALGHAHPESKVPLKTDAIFWIASMTKPITGTAILMLEEEGKLSVNDAVGRFVPVIAELKTPSGKPANLTIKHLMTHTSGLPEATADEEKNARNLAELIPAYCNKPMQFEPGSQWKYCQSGINLLGRIIELTSGLSYDQFLAQRIFHPLGMQDTTFYVRPNQVSRLVAPVKRDKATGMLSATTIGLLHGREATATDHYPAANGGLFSTAPDYSRFARMFLNGGTLDGKRYLKPESVRLMTAIQTGDLKTGFTPGNGWGLTWCVVREPEGVTGMLSPGTYGHGGAYGTQAWLDPVKKVALILMVQRADFGNSDDSPVRRAFQEAALS